MSRSAILAVKILGDASGAQKAFGATEKDLDKLQSGFDGLVGPATAVTAGIVAGAGFAAKAASDLAESQSKVNVVFGESAGEISKWSSTAAQSMGMSQQAALDAAGSFGTMFTQLGFTTGESVKMSTSMITLSADLASFHNVAGGAAQVTDMMSAAMRGEYDSLQALIPTINAKAVQDQALADTGKKSADALTDQEKAAATLKLVMEGAGPAVGDFARTQDGAANSTRTAQAAFTDAAAQLGLALQPAIVAAAGALTQLATWMMENQTAAKILIGVVAGLAAAIVAAKVVTTAFTIAQNAMRVMIGLVRVAQLAWTVATNAYAISAIAAGAASMIAYWPILLIVAAIAAVIAIIVVVVKNWDKLVDAFKAGASWMKNTFVGAWNAVAGAISKVVDWFQKLWDKAKAAMDAVGNALDKINPFSSGPAASPLLLAAPTVPSAQATASTTAGPGSSARDVQVHVTTEQVYRAVARLILEGQARNGRPLAAR